MNQPTKLALSVKDLPAAIGLSKNAAYALVRSGRIHSVRYGRRYVIPLSAVTDFLSGKCATLTGSSK